jgi:outer membrane protein W
MVQYLLSRFTKGDDEVKKIIVPLLISIFGISVISFAADLSGSYYLRFETGLATALGPDLRAPNVLEADLGNTMYFGAGIGYQLFEKVRTDFTVTYRGGFEQIVEIGNVINGKGDFQSTAAMLNLNYEFNAVDKLNNLIPYAGVGFGYVYNHLDQISVVSSDGSPVASIDGAGWANFGVQLGGGITIPLQDQWMIDLGYRYFDGGKYESSDIIHLANGVDTAFSKEVGSLSAHDFTVSLRYRFPW